MTDVARRPDATASTTTRVRVPTRGGVRTLYVTVSTWGDPSAAREVFLRLDRAGTDERAWAEALGRMISLALRAGVQVAAVVKTLRSIAGETAIIRPGGGFIQSAPDAVAWVLDRPQGKG